jgi:outer membrane receptor protein involved in Fe transport
MLYYNIPTNRNRVLVPYRPRLLSTALLAMFAGPAMAQTQAVNGSTESIVVRARKLSKARARIQPSLGATKYQFSASTLAQIAQGSNAPLNQVLLQAPGVAQDSYGQIHVRGDHNEVQYRLDGVELPEGLSVFSQALETRFAHSVDFITGALPAQYGQLQAAVIDIDTKTGITDPGGAISVYGGARDLFQPSFSYGGQSGNWDYFLTGDVLHTRLGIENPTDNFNAIHDLSNQYHGLAHLTYTADADTRVSLIAGVSSAQFQIPNNPGQLPSLGLNVDGVTTVDSASLTEHQREITDFAILSLQKQFGDIDVQSSLFSRYSSLYFTPDPTGDLLFTGIAQTAARSVWSSGTQTDSSWQVNAAHTVRAGLQITGEHTVSNTESEVFFLNAEGGQSSDIPSTIVDGAGKTGGIYGVYLQDEWKLRPGLTLNYGARFDAVDEFTHENQVSPRVNLVWQATQTTTFHAGYSHYFTPPPFELVSANSFTLFSGSTAPNACPRGAGTTSPECHDSTVLAEHDNYFDAGLDHVFLPGLHASIDTYFKSARTRRTDYPHRLQLRPWPGDRRRVIGQLRSGPVVALRQSCRQPRHRQGYRVRPVQFLRFGTRLYFRSLDPSGSRRALFGFGRGGLLGLQFHGHTGAIFRRSRSGQRFACRWRGAQRPRLAWILRHQSGGHAEFQASLAERNRAAAGSAQSAGPALRNSRWHGGGRGGAAIRAKAQHFGRCDAALLNPAPSAVA